MPFLPLRLWLPPGAGGRTGAEAELSESRLREEHAPLPEVRVQQPVGEPLAADPDPL